VDFLFLRTRAPASRAGLATGRSHDLGRANSWTSPSSGL